MISVVIPTHNRPEDLRNAIDSVFNQNFLPDELIVIDDGSSPAVSETVLANAPRELATKLLRNEESKGANNARNKGIKEASGDWIAFLDDDDVFLSNKIKRVSETIEKYGQDIDLIYHSAEIKMVNEGVSYTTNPHRFDAQDDIFQLLLVKNYIGGTSMVIAKKKRLVKVGLFDEKLQSLQDYELWIRLARGGARFYLMNLALTEYHHTTDKKSITQSVNLHKRSFSYIEKKYDSSYSYLPKNLLQKHREYMFEIDIHRAYLNRRYFKSLSLNLEALYETGNLKYLLFFFLSIFGPTVIFKLRSLKG